MSVPQLFCAPNLRCVETAGHLVVLDLSAGIYDVIDEVGTAMWLQLARPPNERDLFSLAEGYGVSLTAVETDFIDFAAAQQAASRLVTEQWRAPSQPVERMSRRSPTVLRGWRERSSAERDLRKGFAAAYAERTGPIADTTAPRADVRLLVKRFRIAESLYPAREAPLDCLPRSLALTRFLRMSGWPAQHVMGVALYPFEAHAWVELAGIPVNESATSLPRFTVIQRA